MIKFLPGGRGTVVQALCDHCHQQITNIGMAGVLFSYETGEFWFYHKTTGCYRALEKELKAKSCMKKYSYVPMWEMSFFLNELVKSFEDDEPTEIKWAGKKMRTLNISGNLDF